MALLSNFLILCFGILIDGAHVSVGGLVLEKDLGNFHDQLVSICTKNIRIPKLYILPTECIRVFPYNSHKNMRLLPSDYNREVFTMETECVYCAVRTEFFTIIKVKFSLHSVWYI
jgi:hypothetical protein